MIMLGPINLWHVNGIFIIAFVRWRLSRTLGSLHLSAGCVRISMQMYAPLMLLGRNLLSIALNHLFKSAPLNV